MIRFLQTPGPLKKIILGGMLLLICAAMVITLVPGGLGSSFGFGGPRPGVVATVAGEEVSTQEVLRESDVMLRQQYPRAGAEASFLRPFLARQASERLINQKVILAEADRLGLRASDEEVRDELQHGRYAATFFPGGNFIGQQEYEVKLQSANLSVGQFEQGVKEQILFDKIRNLVTGAASVPDEEVRKEFQKRNTKVKLEYAVLDREAVVKTLHPAQAELKAFYERNKGTYNNSIPEKRKINYLVIDSAKLQSETSVTATELQTYYDQHRDEYRVAEQVNVRHILIKTPLPGPDGKVDQKGIDDARKQAESILKQLKAGANFAELAKKSSQDDGSAQNGGSIGWIGKGRTVPEFEKTAFSLPKGSTSDLVQSSYGFHIIHVDDKQAAHLKTLDEVRAQIEPALKQQKAARMAESQADALLSQARTNGLEKAAASKGLQVISTDFVSRGDSLPGIGTDARFLDAVFSQAEKAPPDQVQLAEGYAIFDVVAIKPPATPTFEEIRSRVETEFRNERGAALLAQKTRELSDRAKAAHDLKKAAQESGATVKTSEFVGPDGQVPDIGSMGGPAAVAFGMAPGEISGPLTAANAGIVLKIVERQEPSAQEFEAKRDEIRDSLLEQRQSELFGLFLSNLRDQMKKSGKIKINEQEMKTLTRSSDSQEGS